MISNVFDQIYEVKNFAFVYSDNQYIRKRINCTIYELNGFFPSQDGTILISKGLKHKEKINQAYLKMREVGIVDRLSKRYGMKRDPLKNFHDSYSEK